MERKSGLQRKISAIFDGVPMPKGKDAEPSSGVYITKPKSPVCVPPKPIAPESPIITPATTSTITLTPETLAPAKPVSTPATKTPSVPTPPVPVPVTKKSPTPASLTPILSRSALSDLTVKTPPAQEPQQVVEFQPKVTTTRRLKADKTTKTSMQTKWQQTWQGIKDKLFTPKSGVSPSRQITMAILIPVLFIVLVVAFVRVLKTPSSKTTGPSSFETTAAAGSADKSSWKIPDPYPTDLRDPMQFGSLSSIQVEDGGLIVNAIVYSKDKPSAIIANQIVHEGDKVSGATVIKINKDSVEFEMNGKKLTQSIKK